MSDPAELLSQLKDALELVAKTVFAGRCFMFVAWAFFVYDWLICLGDEIEYIWGMPWGLATMLYMFIRYISGTLLTASVFLAAKTDLTESGCRSFFQLEGYSGIIGLLAVQVCLATRIYALWSSSKVILGILVVALVSAVITMCTILAFQVRAFTEPVTELVFIQGAPGIAWRACVPTPITTFFFALWVPAMSFEILCFGLALYKGFSTIVTNFNWDTFGERLVEVIMRDSLLYFVVVVVTEVVVSVIWLRRLTTLIQATVGFAWAIPSVACTRMMLNLRVTYYQRKSPPDEIDLPTSVSRTFGNRQRTRIQPQDTRDDIRMWSIPPTIDTHDTYSTELSVYQPKRGQP